MIYALTIILLLLSIILFEHHRANNKIKKSINDNWGKVDASYRSFFGVEKYSGNESVLSVPKTIKQSSKANYYKYSLMVCVSQTILNVDGGATSKKET